VSEYTPTTEEVRAQYNADEFGYPARLNDPCPEFDDWLSRHDAQIVADVMETERKEQKQWFKLLAAILYAHDGAVKISNLDMMQLDNYGIEVSEDRIEYSHTIKIIPRRREEN
jgi:hypothetical protein